MRDTCEAQVLCTKTSLMQAIQRLVGDGYRHYSITVVPIAKARTFVRKMRDSYLVHLGYSARWRRKKLGLGNARLLLWQENAGGPLTAVLLVSPGEHPAHEFERQLRDARGYRVCKDGSELRLSLTGYELVQYTRRGNEHASWTWRMASKTYTDWRARILRCVRNQNELEMAQAWESLHRSPGFGAIRTQVRQLVKLFRGEHTKRLGKKSPFPLPPRRCWYVAFVRQTSRQLHEVIHEGKPAAPTRHDGSS